MLRNQKGAKGGSGVHQQIINLMPPHRVYVEPFLGRGEIVTRKKRAELNYGFDIDEKVVKAWKTHKPLPFLKVYQGDVLKMAYELLDKTSNTTFMDFGPLNVLYDLGITIKDILVYLDPPYPLKSRQDKISHIYKHEMTNADHTYPNELYAKLLLKENGWNHIDFKTRTRRTTSIERLYYNFPDPIKLHDHSYVGKTYRERERIRKMIARRLKTLQKMRTNSPTEFYALMEAINDKIK